MEWPIGCGCKKCLGCLAIYGELVGCAEPLSLTLYVSASDNGNGCESKFGVVLPKQSSFLLACAVLQSVSAVTFRPTALSSETVATADCYNLKGCNNAGTP